MPYNAAQHFVDRHAGSRLAILTGPTRLTYDGVSEVVRRASVALRDLGVERGDRVLLRLPDGPEFVAAFFGAIRLGAIAVPLNPWLTDDDYRFIELDSGAHLTVMPGSLPTVRHSDTPTADTGPDDPCFMLYTSGTTGRPKGVLHRHSAMQACGEAFGRHVLDIRPDDRCYSTAKLFFAYGLGNSLYYPFGAGASTILDTERFDAERAFAIIARERPTLFFAVPTAYAALLRVAGNHDLSSLRLCLSAGEPLPKALNDRWRDRFGLELLDGIGSTEMCNTFIAGHSVVPGYQVRLDNGEMLVKGESAFSGYWNQPERTRAVLNDGWVRTGDRYRRDDDGRYWFEGRTDDMLKVGGQWVAPAEVEAALLEHPAVREAGVVGAPDADELTKPLAFVVLAIGHQPSAVLEDELKAFVRDRLAPFKYPRWIRFVAQLPRTATGKLQRFRLREMAG